MIGYIEKLHLRAAISYFNLFGEYNYCVQYSVRNNNRLENYTLQHWIKSPPTKSDIIRIFMYIMLN